MTLSDLASLGSFVSGLAVLVSLVYLALQVRQAERNQQASIRQARITRTADLALARLEPSVNDAFRSVLTQSEQMSAREVTQFIALAQAHFLNFEDAYFQFRSGLLVPSAFETAKTGIERLFSYPGGRYSWRALRTSFGNEFAEFMDALLEATPVGPPTDVLAAWNAGVAAEKAATRRAAPEQGQQP
jgi:hypothetical protein